MHAFMRTFVKCSCSPLILRHYNLTRFIIIISTVKQWRHVPVPPRGDTHVNGVLTRTGERQKSRRNRAGGRERYDVKVFDL